MINNDIEEAVLIPDTQDEQSVDAGNGIITISNDTLIVLSVTDQKLAEYRELSKSLSIGGIKDTKNYKAVDALRMQVRKDRFSINRRTEEIKKVLNTYKSKLMTEDDRVSAVLEEIEKECVDKQNVIDNEKDRLKAEKEKEERELIESRTAQLSVYNFPIQTLPADVLKKLSEAEFSSMLAMAKMAFDATNIYRETLEKKAQETKDALQQQLDAIKQQNEQLAQRNAELEMQLTPAPGDVQTDSVNPALSAHTPAEADSSEIVPIYYPTGDSSEEDESVFVVPASPIADNIEEPETQSNPEVAATDDVSRLTALLEQFDAIVLPTMHERKNALTIGRVDIALTEIKDRLRAAIS